MIKICLSIIAIALFSQIENSDSRIAIVGDSLASGLYASSLDKTYANIVSRELNAELLLVASVRNLPGAIRRFDEVELWQPDIIVLEIGLNDISGFGGDAIEEKHWKSIYKLLVKSYQNLGAKVFLVNTFAGWPEGHENIGKQLRYNQYISEVSKETKATLVDIYTPTSQCQSACISKFVDASFFDPGHGDNFHPSDEGHQIISNTILQHIHKLFLFFPIFKIGG